MVLWGLACVVTNAKEAAQYDLHVEVSRQGPWFKTQASFRLPMNLCQAYRFITDYEAAKSIPGVVVSQSTRLDKQRVRVERVLRERILFFPVDMHMVLEFTEYPGKGTDFVQITGQAKFYQGSWRLESVPGGTVFLYQTISQPDSAVPGVVVEYFVRHRLTSSFEALALAGDAQSALPCER